MLSVLHVPPHGWATDDMDLSNEEHTVRGRKQPTSGVISEDSLGLIQAGFDHMDEGISIYDGALRLVAWNKAFVEMIEFPSDLLQVGQPIADLIRSNIDRGSYGKGDPEQILSSRLALLDKAERQTFDRLRSDGGVVEINWFPLPDGGLVITYRDVTKRRRAEEKLRQSEARYARAVTGMNDGLWDWHIPDNQIFLSPRWAGILGYEQGELAPVSETVTDLMHPDDSERVAAAVLAHMEQDVHYDVEHRMRHKNGEYVWVRSRGRVFRDGDGNPLRMAGSLTDISEKKRAEDDLCQAQKMEALGQLTGGVAHEFNNLLLVIVGNIEVLESRLGKDDPLQSFASSAMKGALRGAELTQSLLAFSRKQRLKSGRVDLNELVLSMHNLLQRTLGEAITIEADLAEGLWPTSADAGQIESALLNFLLNARDAMPDGGTIIVRTSNRKMTAELAAHYDGVEPGDYVTLEISDTGTGMTDEQIERAFEPFYTTKEVGKGTGLGLSVAYGFAKQSGGCLEIESEPGQGTTLRLSLPRAAGEGAGAERKQGTSPKAVTGSGTILVLEDDADVRHIVVRQLSRLGYEVFEAENGPEALALLEERPDIDLLFSDVVLPGGMSGPQALAQAQTKHPDLKVLLTSGNTEKDAEDLAVDGRGVPILRKPYCNTELAEAIVAAMSSE